MAVVDSDQAVRDYLVGLFEGSVDTASALEELEPRLEGGACVVVLGPSCARQEDFDTVAAWGKRYPNVAAVLVTSELTTQLLHKALRVGVKDVISAPIEQEQLIDTVDQAATRECVDVEFCSASVRQPQCIVGNVDFNVGTGVVQ